MEEIKKRKTLVEQQGEVFVKKQIIFLFASIGIDY